MSDFQLVSKLSRMLDSSKTFSKEVFPLPRSFTYFGDVAPGYISLARISELRAHLPVR